MSDGRIMSTTPTHSAASAHAALAALAEEAARCRALWSAVVHRVVLDATRADADGAAARVWLTSPDKLALEFAGLDAEPVAEALALAYGGGSDFRDAQPMDRRPVIHIAKCVNHTAARAGGGAGRFSGPSEG